MDSSRSRPPLLALGSAGARNTAGLQHHGAPLLAGDIRPSLDAVLALDLVRAAESVEDPPAFGTAVRTDFILGMGKVGQAVKILLDIDRVLSTAEASQLAVLAA